eukprot:6183732-Pleurochrysis_carterae.AAC.2
MKRKVVLGEEVKKRVALTSALRSQEYYNAGILLYTRPEVVRRLSLPLNQGRTLLVASPKRKKLDRFSYDPRWSTYPKSM